MSSTTPAEALSEKIRPSGRSPGGGRVRVGASSMRRRRTVRRSDIGASGGDEEGEEYGELVAVGTAAGPARVRGLVPGGEAEGVRRICRRSRGGNVPDSDGGASDSRFGLPCCQAAVKLPRYPLPPAWAAQQQRVRICDFVGIFEEVGGEKAFDSG